MVTYQNYMKMQGQKKKKHTFPYSLPSETWIPENNPISPHSNGTALGTFTLTSFFFSHLFLCLHNALFPSAFYDRFTRIIVALLHATCPLSQPTLFSKSNRPTVQWGPFWTQWCTCGLHKGRGIPSPSLTSGDWYQLTIATCSIYYAPLVPDCWNMRYIKCCVWLNKTVFGWTRQWTDSVHSKSSLDIFIDHRYSNCRYNHHTTTWTVRLSFTGRNNTFFSSRKVHTAPGAHPALYSVRTGNYMCAAIPQSV